MEHEHLSVSHCAHLDFDFDDDDGGHAHLSLSHWSHLDLDFPSFFSTWELDGAEDTDADEVDAIEANVGKTIDDC